jgi:glucosamine--fructose-6-phosphate aminotransferase (isomerizing)
MEMRGKYTREEIFSQPEAWEEALDLLRLWAGDLQDFSKQAKTGQIIFTGCGSTYYLSLAAAVLFQRLTSIPARGMPASEVWLSAPNAFLSDDETILVAISRSGETSETLQASMEFRARQHGRIISMVCTPGSSLASAGTINLIFPSGVERSVAQTRAFSTLYLGVMGLSSIWAGRMDLFEQMRRLPSVGKKILTQYSYLAEELGKNMDIDRVYFLGSAERYGLACELNLKMKEMSLTHSEAFHFLEFRHGPKAMVNDQTLVVGLVSERHAKHEMAVLAESAELGAEILTIGEDEAEVSFNSGLEEVNRNLLYLPFGQMLAYERSMAKGFDPDQPMHLDQVVKLYG